MFPNSKKAGRNRDICSLRNGRALGKRSSDLSFILCLITLLLPAGAGSVEKPPGIAELRERLDGINRKLGPLEVKFDKLKKDYTIGAGVFTPSQIKKKFDEGIFSFLKEDYIQASLIFYMITENEGLLSPEEYHEAEWYLAESLYLSENYLPAIEYLSGIIDRGRKTPYYESAIWRLIEIYGILGEREKFELYFQTYAGKAGIEKLSDRMLYSLGKSLYFQGRYSDAIRSFRKVPEGSNIFPMAKYFQGVSYLSMGRMEEATEEFEATLKISIDSKEKKEVGELAIMALARIHYEKGEMDRAIELYQDIPKSSRSFPDALYELSWCYIKKGEYDKAFKTIDILILTFPESRYAPIMKLLSNHLLGKIEDFSRAVEGYEELIREFKGINKDLDDTLSEKKKVVEYFRRMVREKALPAEQKIPGFISSIARSNRDVEQSVLLSKELDTQSEEIKESEKVLADIEEVARGRDSTARIPSFRKGREAINGIRGNIGFLENQLLLLKMEYIKKFASEKDRKLIEKIEKTCRSIEEFSGRVPEIQKDYEEREEVFKFQIEELRKNLVQLRTLIEDFQSQFSAVLVYINSEEGRNRLGRERREEIRKEVDREKDKLSGLSGDLKDVDAELNRFEIEGGLRQFYLGETEETLGRMKDYISKGEILLSTIFEKGPVKGNESFLKEIKLVEDRLDRFAKRVKRFYSGIEEIEEKGVSDLRERIEKEKEDLARFVSEFQGAQEDITEVVGVIGESTFQSMRDFFDNLILKANVGLLDTFWQLKENETRNIREISKEQAERLKNLEENFKTLKEE